MIYKGKKWRQFQQQVHCWCSGGGMQQVALQAEWGQWNQNQNIVIPHNIKGAAKDKSVGT